jgi:serine/threonine protein kinase
MTHLTDAIVDRLRSLGDAPDLTGTRYERAEEIGRGGMGAVYRVHDRQLGRDVALKVVSDVAATPEAAERLAREARALARLEHPGIVPVHDAGVLPDGRSFYVMKLVLGERLDERLRREIALGEALRLFVRVCDAVAFAHASGVIHRDLKPQNVMLGPFGEVLVLDWGLAKMRDAADFRLLGTDRPASRALEGTTSPPATSTLDGVVIGTPGYMAPEQAAGGAAQADERTDVYALGAILRTMSDAAGAGRRRPLAAIVARATAADPGSRYATANALAREVTLFQDGLPVEAYRENLAERALRLARRHRMAVGLVLAYLVMRVALLLLRGA